MQFGPVMVVLLGGEKRAGHRDLLQIGNAGGSFGLLAADQAGQADGLAILHHDLGLDPPRLVGRGVDGGGRRRPHVADFLFQVQGDKPARIDMGRALVRITPVGWILDIVDHRRAGRDRRDVALWVMVGTRSPTWKREACWRSRTRSYGRRNDRHVGDLLQRLQRHLHIAERPTTARPGKLGARTPGNRLALLIALVGSMMVGVLLTALLSPTWPSLFLQGKNWTPYCRS